MSLYRHIDRKLILPLAEKLMGRNLTGELTFLTETQWMSEDDLRGLQNAKLQALVKHCYERVPYYSTLFRSLGLTPDDIRSREDLAKLPILTKELIREHYDELIATDCADRKAMDGSTGGSTGTPMRFKEDIRSWNCLRALTVRGWSWAGFELGEKLFTLAGNSLVKKNTGTKALVSHFIYDRLIMRNDKRNCTDISPEALEGHYQEMIRFKPSAIRGYASSLYFLAKYIEQNNLPVCTVKAVFTTGEKLHPKYRDKIRRVFQAPVFDAYGAADGGVSAQECDRHEGLHIGEEHCILEIVDKDGRPVPDGETGYVVSTDLNNYVFPFLRYKVGDLAYIKKERCSCGRKHRLLGEVIGREGRAIYNKDGRPYSSIILDNMMFKDLDFHSESSQRLYEKIDRFQIRQDKNGDLVILIKPVDPDESPDTFDYIKENFSTYFPQSVIELKFTDDIPTLPSGKEDYCVSDYLTE
jgi:phenylacetate-CoA ligase